MAKGPYTTRAERDNIRKQVQVLRDAGVPDNRVARVLTEIGATSRSQITVKRCLSVDYERLLKNGRKRGGLKVSA